MMEASTSRDAAEYAAQGGCCGLYSLMSGRRKMRLHPNTERSMPIINSVNADKPLSDEELPKIVEQHEEISTIKCIFCEGSVRSFSDESKRLEELESMSLQRLKDELGRSDMDIAWCVERRDLVQVQNLVSAVCSEVDCRELLKLACSRTLECGHRCKGVRAERACLGCLEDGCQSDSFAGQTIFTSGDEMCAICMVDPIRRAPAILLTCGHVVHAQCAKKKIDAGFPGPEISFAFLECALCSQVMQHPILQPHAMKHEKMRDLVRQKVIRRLKMEQREEREKASSKAHRPVLKIKASSKPSKVKVDEPTIERKVEITQELETTEEVETAKEIDISEELVIAALKKYQYYVCFKCKEPYFGGIRNCALGNGWEDGYDPRELMCGSCSAAANNKGKCKVAAHGSRYIEYKCKHCCALATYVCFFGTLHTCRAHHAKSVNPIPECRGPEYCPLGIEHAPNGIEFCLGCSLCRIQGQ